MGAPDLIGVDWGSTHVRAFRFDEAGGVRETRRSDRGAATLAPSAFAGTLTQLLGDWLAGAPKIIVCGMAGAREGWIEAPYLPCPINLSALAMGLIPAPGALDAYIIPGLFTRGDDGMHDVMRGEETQMRGAQPAHDSWLIAPGTHSKWAQLRAGAITRFQTFMTGEAFRLFATQSALARVLDIDAPFDGEAFDLGAARGLEGGVVTRLAFAVRAQSLFGALTPRAAKSYLSGLLIGAEIADGLRLGGAPAFLVIGTEELTAPYERALALAGVADVTLVNGETAAARGLWRVAQGALA